jgi:hypothetical protein
MKINYMVLSSLSLVNKSTMHLGPLLGPTESSGTMNSSSGCKMEQLCNNVTKKGFVILIVSPSKCLQLLLMKCGGQLIYADPPLQDSKLLLL